MAAHDGDTPVSDRLVQLCDDECGGDDDAKMSHLCDALAEIRERLKISAEKATGGTEGECWIAKHFGLEWEGANKTGADATDDAERECEIKASLHPFKTKIKTSKINICYKTLHRHDNESDDAFVTRMQEHICENTGGHFWGTWVAKTPKGAADRIILKWWLPSATLAQLIGKKMRASGDMKKKNSVISINFGAKVCTTCGGVHRIDEIVRVLGGWNGRTDKQEALTEKRAAVHDGVPDAIIDALDAGSCVSQCN